MSELATREASTSYPVFGGAAIIAFTLILTAFAAFTGIGVTRLEPVLAGESRDLTMVERIDGSVIVTDLSEPARTWTALASNGEGFVQVVVQGLMRARTLAGVDALQPFRLMRQPDGRLWIKDLSTQQQLALDAFGPVSARAFAKFLDDGRGPQ